MSNIKIEWLSDEYICEDCGSSGANGANVYIDGVLVLGLIPIAHCFGGTDYSDSDTYKAILEKLGYTVEEV